jgi:S-DNA-T family DNA segregation ATPase FtsK/SpoIIIE
MTRLFGDDEYTGNGAGVGAGVGAGNGADADTSSDTGDGSSVTRLLNGRGQAQGGTTAQGAVAGGGKDGKGGKGGANQAAPQSLPVPESVFILPSMSLLKTSQNKTASRAQDAELQTTAAALQQTLGQFSVDAQVVGWTAGPTVTLYKLSLGEGVRVSRITTLADDIALALAASSVRIFSPIPGTSLVGVEVPNAQRSTVLLGDVLPAAGKGALQLAVGKDVEGDSIVANLAAMPHLLLGGTTGSGKSIAINAMIMSVLMRSTPAQVRMILIDPKMVELTRYNDIPHLYVPVVTDANKAAASLAWSVIEMERRLKEFMAVGVKNIATYNEYVENLQRKAEQEAQRKREKAAREDAQRAEALSAEARDATDTGGRFSCVQPDDALHENPDGDTREPSPCVQFDAEPELDEYGVECVSEDEYADERERADEYADERAGADERERADASAGADINAMPSRSPQSVQFAQSGQSSHSPQVSQVFEPAQPSAAELAEIEIAQVFAELPDKMPYIMIVIDELSDLMMVAGKDVETSITRLSQLARAAGLHLIIATQRPSTNVITGVIKANIVNRIAFNVGSGIDSRVILDSVGAEALLGNGDLLFSKPEYGKPVRIQGCFVSEYEISAVTHFLKEQGKPDYHEEILATAVGGMSTYQAMSGSDAFDADDPLVWEAADIVVNTQMGSTSTLQRRLKVGYARAGRIMDNLEMKGIVGPANGSKPREVLVSDLLELESLRALEQAG